MTQEEYMQEAEKIRVLNHSGEYEQAKKLLDELYQYKPVRQIWFAAKLEYLIDTLQNWDELEKTADEPIDCFLDYPGLREYTDSYIRYSKIYTSSIMQVNKCKEFLNRLFGQPKQYNEILEQRLKTLDEEKTQEEKQEFFFDVRIVRDYIILMLAYERKYRKYNELVVVKNLNCLEGKNDKIFRWSENAIKYAEKNGYAFIIENDYKIEELEANPSRECDMQKLSFCISEYYRNNAALAWYGDYLSYIGDIYQMDIRRLWKQERTSIYSLIWIVHTVEDWNLKIRQEFERVIENRKDIEFVIINNTDSLELDSNLQQYIMVSDKNVTYKKTPHILSFNGARQYAMLAAKGEYLIPIGRNTKISEKLFVELDATIGESDKIDVIALDQSIQTDRIKLQDICINHPEQLRQLPACYRNVCIKYSWLEKVYNSTGRLFDAIGIEGYSAILFSFEDTKIEQVSQTVLHAKNSCIDMEVNTGNVSFYKKDMGIDSSYDSYIPSGIENMAPDIRCEYNSFAQNILRYCRIKKCDNLIQKLDWKRIYVRIVEQLDKRDKQFDKKIHAIRYAAMQHEEDFLNWFDETLYKDALEPEKIR